MRYVTRLTTAVLALSVTLHAGELGSGFGSGALPRPGSGAVIQLSSGELLTYDGSSVDRWHADGSFAENVFTLPGAFFSGCFALSPDETTALIGESSNGDLYTVDLVGDAGGAYLATLVFNFDAAFESNTTAVVSASTCGFGCGNDLARVDLVSGEVTFLAHVEGASGALAVGPGGDLYYATSSADFPAPPGATDLLRFPAADLDGARLLSEVDAELLASGFDGSSSLVIDPAYEVLFLAENNFSTGLNRVLRIPADTGAVTTVYEGNPFDFTSQLQFFAPEGEGFFFPYQPAGSGALATVTTDFFSFDDRLQLAPLRPDLNASGPGVAGAGEFSIELSGAEPGGLALLGVAGQAVVDPVEAVYTVAGLPLLHSKLTVAQTRVLPQVVVLDGAGEGSFGAFDNDGGSLTGLLVFQSLFFSSDAAFLGTSAPLDF